MLHILKAATYISQVLQLQPFNHFSEETTPAAITTLPPGPTTTAATTTPPPSETTSVGKSSLALFIQQC